MKDKTHLYYRQLMQKNADQLLNRAESEQLNEHLAQCAGCRAYAADIAALEGDLCDTLNSRWEQTSDRMIHSIPQMTKVARRKIMFRKSISLVGVAACLVLLAAATIFVVNRLAPVPQLTQAAATQITLANATEEATPTQRPAAAQAALVIVSQSLYKDSSGNFHVVGEIGRAHV
jgi:predicted anti-sigma-YlaC factor YlaD